MEVGGIMDYGLTNRVALVCGSSSGLGLGIAERLVAEGARVMISGRDAAKLAAAAEKLRGRGPGTVAACAADVATEEGCRALFEATRAAFGTVQLLVNNAGGPRSCTFLETTEADWQEALALNLLSVVRLCRLAAPDMIANRFGRILTITSVAAIQPLDNLVLSNAVRAGVHGLSKSLANELAPHGITVNCICPGFTRTERLGHLARSISARSGKSEREVESGWEASIPARRLAEVADFSAAALFLLSGGAGYVTGQKLAVDGGFVRAI